MRAAAPLVHNITNFVVMTPTANALLAAGAAPAMLHAPEEVAEFAAIASALVVNIGTLTAAARDAMVLAVRAARDAGRPWVLDPVAGGVTAFRRETVAQLLCEGPAVVRGNASEIIAASIGASAGRGVDAANGVDEAAVHADALARRIGATVVVSGPVDYITDGTRAVEVANGVEMMTRITGTGCTCTALIGAFLGAGLPGLEAATAAMVLMGVAGEVAAQGNPGPGTFAVRLTDALAALRPKDLDQRGRYALRLTGTLAA
ncbi:hydroxyethylthiazole kinase [Pseudoxanthobacter sp.]|uniref:hydroxyethylthiazole kinase n=1 Tax=Pseudoxanthobacter sp. TaxID=1925742 RepID=UPI002FE20BC3